MNQDKLAALKAAAEAATPGPWNKGASNQGKECVWLDGRTEPKEVMGLASQWIDCNSENNATFISNANPQAILSLIDRLEAAENDAARYRWLRKRVCVDNGKYHTVWTPGGLTRTSPSDELNTDSAIDDAMGADREQS